MTKIKEEEVYTSYYYQYIVSILQYLCSCKATVKSLLPGIETTGKFILTEIKQDKSFNIKMLSVTMHSYLSFFFL